MAVAALPALSPAGPQPTPEIKKAAEEFESMMLAQMLAPMFNSLSTDGMFGGGSGEEMFRPMMIDEYAKGIARNGGIGLSDSIVREMMRMQGMGEMNATAG